MIRRLALPVALVAFSGVARADYFPPTIPQTFTPATGSPGTGPTTPTIAIDDERAAFKGGREYVFTTGNNGTPANPGILVAKNTYLNARICNNGTKNWIIAAFGRFFDSSSASITPYGGIANPDALTTAQAATMTGCGAVTLVAAQTTVTGTLAVCEFKNMN